jgi:hypothetical protein
VTGAAIVTSPATSRPVKVGRGPKTAWFTGAWAGSKRTVEADGRGERSLAAPPPGPPSTASISNPAGSAAPRAPTRPRAREPRPPQRWRRCSTRPRAAAGRSASRPPRAGGPRTLARQRTPIAHSAPLRGRRRVTAPAAGVNGQLVGRPGRHSTCQAARRKGPPRGGVRRSAGGPCVRGLRPPAAGADAGGGAALPDLHRAGRAAVPAAGPRRAAAPQAPGAPAPAGAPRMAEARANARDRRGPRRAPEPDRPLVRQ